MRAPATFDADQQKHMAVALESSEGDLFSRISHATEIGKLGMREEGSGNIDAVIRSLIESEKTEHSVELMDAAAKAAVESDEDFQTWSHNMCHIFEAGVTQRPEFHDGAAIVLAEMIKRFDGEYGAMNVDRSVASIAQDNLTHILKSGLNDDFLFKPEKLNNNDLKERFADKKQWADSLALHFIHAETPATYLDKVMECGIPFNNYKEDSKVDFIEALSFLQTRYDDQTLAHYMEKTNVLGDEFQADVSVEQVMQHYGGEFKKGSFFDVEGSLIINGKLNITLAALLITKREIGEEVTIFTSGNTESLEQQLTALGVPDAHVQSKADYAGCVLEKLFDDTAAGIQGFRAMRQEDPIAFADLAREQPFYQTTLRALRQKRNNL